MKKRILAVVLSLVFTVGTLTGCGKGTASTGESAKTEATEKKAEEVTEEASATEEKVIKVGIGSASPNTAFINDDGELDGYDVELLKLIDEKLVDYTIEFVTLEPAALFASLDTKKVDFVDANFRRSDAREEKYIHTYRSYFYTPYVLITLAENGELDSLEDYIGKTVATGDGSLMADIIEQYIGQTNADINLVYATDFVGELTAGRVDGVALPRTTIKRYEETYPDLEFYVGKTLLNGTDECMGDANAYWWFNPGSEDLRDAISEAVYEIRQAGTLLELSNKWYGVDYVSDIDVDAELKLIEEYGITDAAK